MKKSYTFPSIVTKEDKGYSVVFPDLSGCLPYGRTLEEVNKNAQEALALHLYGMDKDGEQIPDPSESYIYDLKKNQAVMLVRVIMAPYLQKLMNQAVKKTLTIPKWMDDLAKDRDINYSQVLQSALRETLGVDEDKKLVKS